MNNPRIFVINLDRSKERWENMKDQELRLNNIKLERVSGVDGFLLDKEELNKREMITPFCLNFCSMGMIGCWLSHLKVWKKVVDENLPYAIVLEDDTIFPENYSNKINGLLPLIPENADIVLLGCSVGGRDDASLNLVEQSFSLFYKPRDYASINQEIIIPKMFVGSYAYLITQQGARKCIKEMGKANYHIDHDISKNKKLNLYAVRKQNEWFKTFSSSNTSTLNGESNSQNKVEKPLFNSSFSLEWLMDAPIAELPFGIVVNVLFFIKVIIIICFIIILVKKK